MELRKGNGGEFVWDGVELKDRRDPRAGGLPAPLGSRAEAPLASHRLFIYFHPSGLMRISEFCQELPWWWPSPGSVGT